ncbi:hypothetical protein BKA65DRAFT_574563 [Rhexocercosporidium sp. MPI-PUGE-AT-0058]|nr:hypothetical protein BKA65DRAFT_574563 [Rhexocercosporidium sp. MPI-PUGE-AT-0058]
MGSIGPGIPGGLWAKLPYELAVYIWELAAQGPPRLVHLTFPGQRVEADAPVYTERHHELMEINVRWPTQQEISFKKIELAQTSSLVPPSPIIGVCRQSRCVASRVLGQSIAAPWTQIPTIWFSPEDDTLFLSESTLRKLFCERQYAVEDLGLDLSRVQKLALSKGSELDDEIRTGPPYWRGHLTLITGLLQKFPNLKLVTFVAQIFNPTDIKNLVMMDLHDVDRLTDVYKRGYYRPGNCHTDEIADGAELARKELVMIRSTLEQRRTQNGYNGWELPQIEIGAITTLQKRVAFYEARDAFFRERETFHMMLKVILWDQPQRSVEFCAAHGSNVEDMIIWFRYLQGYSPSRKIAVMFKGKRLVPEEKVLNIPFLKKDELFEVVIGECEQDLPRYTGHRSKHNTPARESS